MLVCAGIFNSSRPLMDKKTPVYPPIANAADYIDALIRPRSKDVMLKKKVIAGRRMRDKYRDEVVVTQVVNRLD
jgi:hypothetical protein